MDSGGKKPKMKIQEKFKVIVLRMIVDISKMITNDREASIIKILNTDPETSIVDQVTLDFVSSYIESQTPVSLILNFVYFSHSCWDSIQVRDESFLIEKGVEIFTEGLTSAFDFDCTSHIRKFKNIFSTVYEGEYLITGDDREMIWSYFDEMVKYAIKYVHKFKRPTWKIMEGGKPVKGYDPVYDEDTSFLDGVKAASYAKKWRCDLKWPEQA